MPEGAATSPISRGSHRELIDLTGTAPLIDLGYQPTTLRGRLDGAYGARDASADRDLQVDVDVDVDVEDLSGLDGGYVHQVRQRPWAKPPIARRASLRALDVIGAAAALVFLSPVIAAIAVSVRASSPGKAIYRHRRVGEQGREFDCLKFRSMYSDADERLEAVLQDPASRRQWDQVRKIRNDPRVTPIGRLLRRWELDELPQLVNVLQGSMSLVGPRPVPGDEAERYALDLAQVLSVKPGMTGLWQVSGRNDIAYSERVAIDVDYVKAQSLGLNLSIMLRTVRMILSPRSGS